MRRHTVPVPPWEASFALAVPDGLLAPLALSTSTTLDVAGHPPLTVEQRFIVNGQHIYLPFVSWSQ